MRWFRGIAIVLIGVMLLAISSSAFAATKDDTASPLYLYTRTVKASLSISDSGKATCVGNIRANSAKSDISMTVALYKKSGLSWTGVTSWSESASGQILEIEKTRQVTGAITNESMRAGTWYLYATATYGGTNDAYPISIGANDLYYNETYISAGGYFRGAPTESTSSKSDAQGNKTSITLNYSRPVGVQYAARASKTDASVAPSNYSYGPTNGSTKDFTISFSITCSKK